MQIALCCRSASIYCRQCHHVTAHRPTGSCWLTVSMVTSLPLSLSFSGRPETVILTFAVDWLAHSGLTGFSILSSSTENVRQLSLTLYMTFNICTCTHAVGSLGSPLHVLCLSVCLFLFVYVYMCLCLHAYCHPHTLSHTNIHLSLGAHYKLTASSNGGIPNSKS